jgi:hypothetical protein
MEPADNLTTQANRFRFLVRKPPETMVIRIRSVAFTMETPEIPSGASFFDQQAGN